MPTHFAQQTALDYSTILCVKIVEIHNDKSIFWFQKNGCKLIVSYPLSITKWQLNSCCIPYWSEASCNLEGAIKLKISHLRKNLISSLKKLSLSYFHFYKCNNPALWIRFSSASLELPSPYQLWLSILIFSVTATWTCFLKIKSSVTICQNA